MPMLLGIKISRNYSIQVSCGRPNSETTYHEYEKFRSSIFASTVTSEKERNDVIKTVDEKVLNFLLAKANETDGKQRDANVATAEKNLATEKADWQTLQTRKEAEKVSALAKQEEAKKAFDKYFPVILKPISSLISMQNSGQHRN